MENVTERPLTWFKLRSNSRSKSDPEKIQRLAESIRKEGQLQALVAFEDGTLTAGYDRYAAMMLLKLASATVTVIPGPFNEEKFRVVNFVENAMRTDISVYDRCVQVAGYAKMFPQKTNKEIGDELHVDQSMVSRWRLIEKVIPSVRQSLADDRIGLTDMAAIAGLNESEQQAALDLKLAGATRDEVRAHVRKHKSGKGDQPSVKTKRIKAPVPGKNATVVVTATGELTLFEFVDVLVELCKLAKRAEADGLDSTTFEKVLRDRSKSQAMA